MSLEINSAYSNYIPNQSYGKNAVKNSESFNNILPNELQGGTVLSTINVQTGESIGIYYDENDSGTTQMIAIVKSPDGSVKEIKIDPEKVDPSNASYVEMLALSAHLKQQGKIDGVPGAFASMVFASKVKEKNLYAKQDFMSGMSELLRDTLQNGQMDTYLRYLKEITIYESMLRGKDN